MLKKIFLILSGFLVKKEYFKLVKFPSIYIDTTLFSNKQEIEIQKFLCQYSITPTLRHVRDSKNKSTEVLHMETLIKYKSCIFYCINPQSKSILYTHKDYQISQGYFIHKICGFKKDFKEFEQHIVSVTEKYKYIPYFSVERVIPSDTDSGYSIVTSPFSSPKTLDHVYHSNKYEIFNLIKDFFTEEKKKECEKLGIFYGEGLLLYGPPGTGKSSLVIATAKQLNIPFKYLNLRNDEYTSLQIEQVLSSPGLYLIEDVNPEFLGQTPHKVRVKYEGFNYETLLNILDGPLATPGRFIIYTSNSPQDLPKTMFRKGRVSYKYKMSYMEEPQFIEMFEKFFPLEPLKKAKKLFKDIISVNSKISPADIQAYFLTYLNNTLGLYSNYQEIFIEAEV